MYRREQDCYTAHTFPNLLYFCVKNADLFHPIYYVLLTVRLAVIV